MDAQVKRRPFEVRGGQLRDIFGEAVQRRVPLAEQGSAGMVHKAAEGQRADVVDPLHRRSGIGDDILAVCIIEETVGHETPQGAEIRRTKSSLTTLPSSSTRPKSMAL